MERELEGREEAVKSPIVKLRHSPRQSRGPSSPEYLHAVRWVHLSDPPNIVWRNRALAIGQKTDVGDCLLACDAGDQGNC